MEQHTLQVLNNVNRAIIKFRGLYSAWSAAYDISYNEMLVLYTIREHGYCTQKQICDRYLLPRQTINNVIAHLRKNGILEIASEQGIGREKAFVLTEKGKEYAAPLLENLNTFEKRAVELLGSEKLEILTELMMEYDQALQQALQETRE